MSEPLVTEERITELALFMFRDPDPRPERMHMHAEDAIRTAIRETAEECAKLVEYRGQFAVQMINAYERIEEKKSYAWDCLQHAIAIRERIGE